jgi:hypothetical protein
MVVVVDMKVVVAVVDDLTVVVVPQEIMRQCVALNFIACARASMLHLNLT